MESSVVVCWETKQFDNRVVSVREAITGVEESNRSVVVEREALGAEVVCGAADECSMRGRHSKREVYNIVGHAEREQVGFCECTVWRRLTKEGYFALVVVDDGRLPGWWSYSRASLIPSKFYCTNNSDIMPDMNARKRICHSGKYTRCSVYLRQY